MTDSYNGFSNYATWNVMLWLQNDEHAYKEMMRQLVFWVTQQHKKRPKSLPETIQIIASRVFNERTPDGVITTAKRSEVNWDECAATLRDIVEPLLNEWQARVNALPRNPMGGASGIVDAAVQFRKEHGVD